MKGDQENIIAIIGDGSLSGGEALEGINFAAELGSNFIEYAVAVNSDRAIPDAKSGLKPVAKRIIYGAYSTGRTSNKPHVKCARIVGDVMGKFHPHGDSSIYGALVRLAQPWVLRYPLIDFHGNMGNIVRHVALIDAALLALFENRLMAVFQLLIFLQDGAADLSEFAIGEVQVVVIHQSALGRINEAAEHGNGLAKVVGDMDKQHEHYGEHQQYKPQKDIVGLQEVLHGAIIRQGYAHNAIVICLGKVEKRLLRRRRGADEVALVRLNRLCHFRTCQVVVHFAETHAPRIILYKVVLMMRMTHVNLRQPLADRNPFARDICVLTTIRIKDFRPRLAVEQYTVGCF